MAKKFTVDQFKITFAKPPAPKGVSKKKDSLESHAKRFGKDDSAGGDFAELAAEIYRENADYYVDLLSYKVAKHWKDSDKKIWWNKSPKEAVEKVLNRLYEKKDLGEKEILEEIETNGSELFSNFLYDKHPDLLMTAARKKISELSGKELEKFGSLLPVDARTALLKESFTTGNDSAAKACNGVFPFLPLNEQMDLAKSAPKFFVKNVFFPAHENGENALQMLKNPQWRDILKKDPECWEMLTDRIPALSVGKTGAELAAKRLEEEAKRQNATSIPEPTQEQIVDGVFDSLCQNKGIKLTYFTNPIDTDHALLGGASELDERFKNDKIEQLKAQGYDIPDKPATQCHNLKKFLMDTLSINFGPTVRLEEGVIRGMLLTKPIDKMPGGLLPNTFGGNVRDERGTLTKQVMFTGMGGVNSHTWIIVNGVAYDAVLGTKGTAVGDSVADEFTWVVADVLAKGKSGQYIIKDPALEVAPNKHGFGTCYRLTNTPEDFVKGVYGIGLEIAGNSLQVKELLKGGPAENVFAINDTFLKVDGQEVDKQKSYDYCVGNVGQKRVFEIRRGKKKMKLSLVAVSPLDFE